MEKGERVSVTMTIWSHHSNKWKKKEAERPMNFPPKAPQGALLTMIWCNIVHIVILISSHFQTKNR